MSKREAERFASALQQPVQGRPVEAEMAALVETARRLEALAEPPPPAPHRLAPGRQRLLAEAAQLRSAKIERREPRRMSGVMKLSTALLALVLVVGLTFGASQAAAASLPGELLYSLKLAVEETRLALTSDPEARVALNLALAEERLDEVNELLAQGQAVDEATAGRVEWQLRAALDAAPVQALEALAVAIQQRQRTMEQLAGETPDEPLRQIIREMERVRQEAHAGQGEPQGEQHRQRGGTPQEPTAMPPGADHTPGPAGPKATDQPGPGPVGPQPTDQPGVGPGANPSHTPEPVGPQPTDPPGAGPGPQPSHTPEPVGPQPTDPPGGGMGSGPGEPAGPQPTEHPGNGSGVGQGQP